MSANVGVERCFSFINCQLQPGGQLPSRSDPAARWFVTISRESGCAAHVVGARLADRLNASELGRGTPWTVFDRNLVERVIEDHHLPKRFEKYMPENRVTEIADIMDELFDLHPSSWTLVHKTSETMLRLAELGHCILIGRAAPVVTGKLEFGFHARLIGSFEKRIERMMHFEELGRHAARTRVQREDRGRRLYVKKYFRGDVSDPLQYHLVINTDCFANDQAARLIAQGLLDLAKAG